MCAMRHTELKARRTTWPLYMNDSTLLRAPDEMIPDVSCRESAHPRAARTTCLHSSFPQYLSTLSPSLSSAVISAPSVAKSLQCCGVSYSRCFMCRSLATVALAVYVGTSCNECLQCCSMSILRCEMGRSAVTTGFAVYDGTRCNESLQCCTMSLFRCKMGRGPTIVVLDVYVRPSCNESLQGFHMTVSAASWA